MKFYQLWDPKNIIWGTLVVLLIFALIFFSFYYPQMADSKRLSGFDSQTEGQLIEYQPVENLKQTKLGTEVVTDRYKITYSYTVNGQKYQETESIEGLLKYGNILDRIRSKEKHITVLYMSTEPSKSTVDLEN